MLWDKLKDICFQYDTEEITTLEVRNFIVKAVEEADEASLEDFVLTFVQIRF